jgi:hypothetical protein
MQARCHRVVRCRSVSVRVNTDAFRQPIVSAGNQIERTRTTSKETEMSQASLSASTLELGSRCYRLTARGRACVEVVERENQTLGSLSRYLHDVLMMCGSGMWFEQLRQFMPPRSLEESLRSLLLLGLIEEVAPGAAPPYLAPARTRSPAPRSFSALAAG